MSLAPDETLDHLAGEWRIFQLRQGHRFSADDTLTAWTASRSRPHARRLLDLGAGIGSVGLLTLWRMHPAASLIGIEIQRISLDLARRTAALNRLDERVQFRHGDLRDEAVLAGEAPFELITGSPPYFPPERAVTSPHPQRAGARVELNGDVFDYCRTAARHLTADGTFCFCHVAADPRPERAVADAGLTLLARHEVVFRSDQPPLVALFTCTREGVRRDPPPFVVRDSSGQWTDEYIEMRREMGTVVWRKS